MAQIYDYWYEGRQTTKQDKCRPAVKLDKARIWLDFNEYCSDDREGELYLFSQADIVNDSEGNDVELYEGLEVSVFDDDLDESNQPDAILAEGIIVKNTLKKYTNVKWFIRLIKNKVNNKSGNPYVYWLSDL